MDSRRAALFRALAKSHPPMLRACLGLGVSLAYEPGDPAPVFHVALSASCADLDVLRLLDDHGADPATPDAYDLATPLHLAIALPEPEILDWLLAQGLDVNARTRKGETALMRAAELPQDEDDDPVVMERALRDARTLIAAGADINLSDAAGQTALHYAVAAGATDLIALLLLAGADATAADSVGDTPLHLAATGGRDAVTRRLLQSGADPRAINRLGFSALHVLAECLGVDITPAHLRLADALIKAGGDLEQSDNRGFTPLIAAAATGNIPIAAVFVAHRADIDAQSSAALRQAVLFEDDDMTDLLLKAGAAADSPSEPDNERPLHTAAHEGFVHGVEALLRHGADIEARNIDGETALLIAARRQKYDVAGLLIERGADIDVRDQYGGTLFMLAERRNDARLLQLLQATADH